MISLLSTRLPPRPPGHRVQRRPKLLRIWYLKRSSFCYIILLLDEPAFYVLLCRFLNTSEPLARFLRCQRPLFLFGEQVKTTIGRVRNNPPSTYPQELRGESILYVTPNGRHERVVASSVCKYPKVKRQGMEGIAAFESQQNRCIPRLHAGESLACYLYKSCLGYGRDT